MPVDSKKRQKQLEKKAAKRKAASQAARKDTLARAGGSAERQLAFASTFPIHACLVPEGIFDVGIGNVIVSRTLPGGDIGAGFFLVDVYCLGIEVAFFQTMPEAEYLLKTARFGQHETLANVDPSCARKLVEDAEAYARGIGFDPHPDYALTRRIFGHIDPSLCPTQFTFGKDGKPLFVSGPRDTMARCRKILDTLMNRLGPDGFHYSTGNPDAQGTT